MILLHQSYVRMMFLAYENNALCAGLAPLFLMVTKPLAFALIFSIPGSAHEPPKDSEVSACVYACRAVLLQRESP